MKKLFQLGAVFFSILVAQASFAQNTMSAPNAQRATATQQSTLNPTTPTNYTQDQNHGYGEQNQNRGWSQGNERGWDQGQGNNDGYHGYTPQGNYTRNTDGSYSGEGCPEDHCCQPVDQNCGDQWSLYCHYEPCYYTTKRCVEEQVPCKKRCCRMCPKYYEVTRCKYVPQYYTETVCCQEPEYYDVDECKTCKRWVCDRHCKYVQKYYWKHTCGATQKCDTACPR